MHVVAHVAPPSKAQVSEIAGSRCKCLPARRGQTNASSQGATAHDPASSLDHATLVRAEARQTLLRLGSPGISELRASAREWLDGLGRLHVQPTPELCRVVPPRARASQVGLSASLSDVSVLLF